MDIFNFYNLDECSNRKIVKKRLDYLQDEGKIEYTIDSDILKLKDIDLDENEVIELAKFLDNNDIFNYPDYEDSEESDDYDDYDEEDSEY